MSKLTIEEKRLKALRQQLFGKSSNLSPKLSAVTVSPQIKVESPKLTDTGEQTLNLESAYLKKDLRKILILGGLALILQLCLYFSVQNHLIGFKF